MRYPENIMKDLRQREGLEPNDTSMDEELQQMSPNEAFDEVLMWNGLIGYARTIKSWIEDIYNIEIGE